MRLLIAIVPALLVSGVVAAANYDTGYWHQNEDTKTVFFIHDASDWLVSYDTPWTYYAPQGYVQNRTRASVIDHPDTNNKPDAALSITAIAETYVNDHGRTVIRDACAPVATYDAGLK